MITRHWWHHQVPPHKRERGSVPRVHAHCCTASALRIEIRAFAESNRSDFDDRQTVKRIARYFDVTESCGLFVPYFTNLNFTLGIVGTPNPTANLTDISNRSS